MRRRKKKIITNQDAKADMTPMLDIIFILLIFFIVTTSFVKDDGFEVRKPDSHKSLNNSSKIIMIHIDENNTIFFNNRMIDIERLPAQIEYFLANNPTETILVRPHEETRHQQVVDILDQIRPFKNIKISIGIYKP